MPIGFPPPLLAEADVGVACVGLVFLLSMWWLADRAVKFLRKRAAVYWSQEAADERRLWRQQRQRARQVAAAEAQARRYYARHAALLGEDMPPELFDSLVRSHITEGIDPADAWRAGRDVVAHLQPMVRAALARRSNKARELAELVRKVAELRREARSIRASRLPIEVKEAEAAAIEGQIMDLLDERKQLESER